MFVSEKTIAAIVELAGLATPMALRVAVTLGLPDRLRGDGADVEQVAPNSTCHRSHSTSC